MTSSKTSIFISHVNDDPDAEEVLQALINDLKKKLAPTHDGYGTIFDRAIGAGTDWRTRIESWLFECPAAIVLVSRRAFDDDKPWVSHETSYLTIDQSRRRPELVIIPVLVQDVERQLAEKKAFNPSRLEKLNALRYPGPRITTLDELMTAIAERLKDALPAYGEDEKRLVGLAAVLREKLSKFPPPAQNAAADVLDPGGRYINAGHLAKQFLAADNIKTRRAFDELCDETCQKQFFRLKLDVACILGAQGVEEEDVKPIAIEAAIPSKAGCGRALLLDSEDPDIIDLYLTRTARRAPHAWCVIDANSVLEYGHLDDLKKSVRKIVAGKFGTAAGRSENLQRTRGNAVVRSKREEGCPVLLKLDYPAAYDPAATFRAIREECPELMVLYTASPELSSAPPQDATVCQISPLGVDGYGKMIGPYGAMIDRCHTTTPEEEPQSERRSHVLLPGDLR